MWKTGLPIFLALISVCVYAQEISFRSEKLNGKDIYLAWRGVQPQPNTPVLVALHGSGRSALSYADHSPQSVPFYIKQRDLALQAGYLFASISNGKDTWGTEEGLQGILALIQFVKKEYRTTSRWCFWASSAGGVLLGWLLKEHSELVECALGTFPVYDLADSYSRLNSARLAWPDSIQMAKINPANFPEVFAKMPYLIVHGTDDQAVPLAIHSHRLAQEANQRGGKVKLITVPGGHSTENVDLYPEKLILEFLRNR